MTQTMDDDAEKLLERAARALNAGRDDDARELAESVLGEHPSDPRALQIAGIAHCQLGNPDRGSELLGTLVELVPDDGLTRLNLGNALIAARAPERALEHLEKAVALAPDLADAWHLLGIARRDSQQPQDAVIAWRKALELNPDHAAAASAVATAGAQQGGTEAAEQSLRAAVERNPSRPALQYNLGLVLAQQGKFDEAVARFEQTLSLNARHLDAREALAAVLEAMGRYDEAAHHLRQAVRRSRDDPDLRYKLAAALERNNQSVDASAVIGAALEQWPEHAGLRLVQARILRRDGRIADAKTRLDDVDIDAEPLPLRVALHQERGRLADLDGQSEPAMASFAAGNQAARELFEELYPDGNPFAVRLEKLRSFHPASEQSESTPDDVPVFVVGFPRSGTTLTGRILAAHPAFDVLEEVDTINALADDIDARDGGYPDGLGSLGSERVEQLRTQYRARTQRQTEHAGKRLVDKMPLNLLDAPLIHRVFPGAPIVFVERDPRDAVLSAYMQAFSPTPGMSRFFDLGEAASAYDMFLEIWSRAADALDLNVHTLRYERLVSDFDAEVARLLDFLDAPWDESVRNFAHVATNIKTASADQVQREIYQDSVGRWRRYRQWIDPVSGPLAAWIERFDYPAS